MTAEKADNGRKGARKRSQSAAGTVLVVTGMSGAGKTAALKALEDFGYEAVDNLPLSLLATLAGPGRKRPPPLAIGVDIRTRDFGATPFLREIDALGEDPGLTVRLIFLDADDESLRRRFTETRRRHPLALDRPLADGIRHERRLIAPLRRRADTVIDTSNLKLHDLKRLLHGNFALDRTPGVALFVTSFSYRNGLPPEADVVIDARFLANPHYEPELRDKTGCDADVGAYILSDPGFQGFFDSLTGLLLPLLPRFSEEGKSYLTIAIGCTGGRHRSVYVAERLAAWLREQGQRVGLSHRELPEDADG